MFFTPIALLIVANPVFGGTLVQSDFSSSLGPFSICNAKSPSAGTISHKALSMYFDENDYDGTRDDRGVEICVFKPETRSNVPQMHKEGWQGFRLYVPSRGFPHDKSTVIAQQFCPTRCISWCGTLEIIDNSVVVNHRSTCGTPVTTTIIHRLKRNSWHDVVIRMRVSAEKDGAYEVWWNKRKIYSSVGIDVGFGTWTKDTLVEGWYFKNGIYAHGKSLCEREAIRRPQAESKNKICRLGVLHEHHPYLVLR